MKLDTEAKKAGIKRKATISKTGSAKRVVIQEIDNLTGEGQMEAVKSEAQNWIHIRMAKRVLSNNQNMDVVGEDNNSFDVVAITKKQADLKDEFHINRIKNGSMNNCSDHVFKSSRVMEELAVQMDVTGPESILQQENAYFDVIHTHVHGFKSLGLWFYHPTMRKIIRLASMDIRSENTKDIALFFTMFNEILQNVTGKPDYKFNPRYFMCNEGGTNHKAIKYAYGEEFAKARVVGCQWHFRSNATKKARSMPEDMQDIFNKTCKKRCKLTTTTSQYNLLKRQLEELAKEISHYEPLDTMVACIQVTYFCTIQRRGSSWC